MPKVAGVGAAAVVDSPPLQPFSPDRFAIGIMVVPSNAAYRAAARQTWLNEAIKHATAVFVAGDVPCAHTALDREAGLHGDIVFVDSDDCKKWHSPAKIHAWYTYALKAYPQATWIAKMEDDGILWTKPLVAALGSVRQRGSVYAGMMHWQGGCEHSDLRSASGAEQACAGCWGGWFNGGAPAPRHCMPMWRTGWPGSVKTNVPECPSFHLAPFACGPFEARTRHLALAVSRCEYAKNYFSAMSRRGTARSDWCVSADGGQGHAVGACVRTVHIADLGPHRQKYAHLTFSPPLATWPSPHPELPRCHVAGTRPRSSSTSRTRCSSCTRSRAAAPRTTLGASPGCWTSGGICGAICGGRSTCRAPSARRAYTFDTTTRARSLSGCPRRRPRLEWRLRRAGGGLGTSVEERVETSERVEAEA